ncbi:MAG: hypothetical protein Q7K42_06590, partial [Candidatus Diapherotrites archaeon]|nr:hypothetical protein [Candidatus Diapherotrites archaeon]
EKYFFKTITFIAITNKLETHTKSFTLQKHVQELRAIQENGAKLVHEFFNEFPEIVLRRAGIRVSGLITEQEIKEQAKQKNLFEF